MTDVPLPLFGDEDGADRARSGVSFAAAQRLRLDEHSWVEHVPGWLAGADDLFAELLALPGWTQRRRRMYDEVATEPRLTAEYPDARAAPSRLRELAGELGEHYGVDYDRLWLNLYRDHRDSTGWHGDGASARRRECVVPVLSLGAPRHFLLRPYEGGPSRRLRPASGDLVVMGGRCQTDWRHCVPKQGAASGPRISVNFAASSQAVPDP
ncbi:alpha-ketoglutarate-dependent dioxygenase AlkB [Phycicoccus sp. DTK01]|uniref:alpha-ketoglutarate-dependent dioxygenase AlkB n=1 Tax=Phycicoccus sp. DTK01 TaxID=2785745 RepID=UPI001A8E8DD6|nr:alpha-ketoglutarate-dependent dioxygenase AlkB [Phycicoccus sp. DTK01]GIL36703.1 alkylated DNA repair protein [Phycicoccus sp. DTK01]